MFIFLFISYYDNLYTFLSSLCLNTLWELYDTDWNLTPLWSTHVVCIILFILYSHSWHSYLRIFEPPKTSLCTFLPLHTNLTGYIKSYQTQKKNYLTQLFHKAKTAWEEEEEEEHKGKGKERQVRTSCVTGAMFVDKTMFYEVLSWSWWTLKEEQYVCLASTSI